jgi:predicted XRE-type DNA-binding protein
MKKRVVRVGPKRHEVSRSTPGGVFLELGYADATEHQLRVQLAMQLNELIEQRRLTQAKTATILGVPQPHVSELKNYKLTRFSSERLMRFLTLLDRDVEIVIRRKTNQRSIGHVSVVVA